MIIAEEKNYENKIKKFLKDNGVWYVKYFANRNTRAGIPDILACIGGRFVGIEVKGSKGKVSELQKHQLNEIRRSGGIALVTYPDDFDYLKDMVNALKKGGEECEYHTAE